VQAFAQFFADNGYATSELWAIGYEGDLCVSGRRPDAPLEHRAHQPGQRARPAPLRTRRARLHACKQVDIVAHSLGVTIAREWNAAGRGGPPRSPHGRDRRAEPRHHQLLAVAAELLPAPGLRRLHAVERSLPGLGSPRTPFLRLLNDGDQRRENRAGKTVVIRNADTSFVYFRASGRLLLAGAGARFGRHPDRLLEERQHPRR
jgi:hypothetical protein